MSLNDTFLPSELDLLRVGALAQEQLKGSEDDAFSRTGLTRDHRESRMKRDVKFIDQREVLDIELL
jgi:hypothetical protein